MRLADIKVRMLVKVAGRSCGEVLRVGMASVWVALPTAHGTLTIVANPADLQPAERSEIRIGGFMLRHLGSGKLWLDGPCGGMECDEAQLESLLTKFWDKHF